VDAASRSLEGDDIVFYPDSGRVGIFAENHYELFAASAVDYSAGEHTPR
jgi:hypothetical protein